MKGEATRYKGRTVRAQAAAKDGLAAGNVRDGAGVTRALGCVEKGVHVSYLGCV